VNNNLYAYNINPKIKISSTIILIVILLKIDVVHDNAIFNFAWAEPQMKLITACGDQSSKLCSLSPSGTLDEETEFFYNSSVKSVMFCPGSSGMYNEKINCI